MESNLHIPEQRNIVPELFWGMAVFLVILVNTPGNFAISLSPLFTAGWNGLTFAELVFPSFLFSVGNAIFFAQGQWSQLERQEVLIIILKRTLVIFSLGVVLALALNTYREIQGVQISGWEDLRIMAVLQRIALSYGVAAVAVLYFSESTLILMAMASLVAYWVCLYAFDLFNAAHIEESTFVHPLDLLLPADHHSAYRERGVVLGPEGLLSTLPAVANVLAGYMIARFIKKTASDLKTTTWLLLVGNVIIFLALWWNLNYWSAGWHERITGYL